MSSSNEVYSYIRLLAFVTIGIMIAAALTLPSGVFEYLMPANPTDGLMVFGFAAAIGLVAGFWHTQFFTLKGVAVYTPLVVLFGVLIGVTNVSSGVASDVFIVYSAALLVSCVSFWIPKSLSYLIHKLTSRLASESSTEESVREAV